MKSSEPWFFACFSELTCIGCIAQILSWFYAWNSVPSLLGTLHLCQILLNDRNLASLPLSMDWFLICFYEKLGTLTLCLFLRTHMYWLHSPNPEPVLCSELWNPSLLCWNPASLPDSMDCSEPSFFIHFYEELRNLILCLFLWTAQSFILILQRGIHMYWLHNLNLELLFCLKLCSLSAWNPGTLL